MSEPIDFYLIGNCMPDSALNKLHHLAVVVWSKLNRSEAEPTLLDPKQRER